MRYALVLLRQPQLLFHLQPVSERLHHLIKYDLLLLALSLVPHVLEGMGGEHDVFAAHLLGDLFVLPRAQLLLTHPFLLPGNHRLENPLTTPLQLEAMVLLPQFP